jgi:uncharacterized membrane protein
VPADPRTAPGGDESSTERRHRIQNVRVPRTLAVLLTAAAVCWTLILLLAPIALSRGHSHFAPPAALVYEASGRICHQRPERSFKVGGVQQPVCARCFGLYASGAAGALLAWAVARRRPASSRDRLLLAVCAAPTALTWGLEYLGIAYPSSITRAVAAVPLGLVAGFIVVQSLRQEGQEPALRT